jgi:hypothetical protein
MSGHIKSPLLHRQRGFFFSPLKNPCSSSYSVRESARGSGLFWGHIWGHIFRIWGHISQSAPTAGPGAPCQHRRRPPSPKTGPAPGAWYRPTSYPPAQRPGARPGWWASLAHQSPAFSGARGAAPGLQRAPGPGSLAVFRLQELPATTYPKPAFLGAALDINDFALRGYGDSPEDHETAAS